MPNLNTALHLACENCDLTSVKILIAHGAARDLIAFNKDKETPLMISERLSKNSAQHSEIYKYLKGVVEEQEEKSRKANEELVRQEDEERERKKTK
jgi:hypothetical protein